MPSASSASDSCGRRALDPSRDGVDGGTARDERRRAAAWRAPVAPIMAAGLTPPLQAPASTDPEPRGLAAKTENLFQSTPDHNKMIGKYNQSSNGLHCSGAAEL